jgi:ABC-type lipoprotein release transport system permease subunit
MAWRNLWRHSRRTALTASAIAFSTGLLIFLNSLQLGAYDMMVESSVRLFSGPIQVQRRGYNENPKMRSCVPGARALAGRLRESFPGVRVAVRSSAFALAGSGTRTCGAMVMGSEPALEPGLSSLPGLVKEGRWLKGDSAAEAVLGETLARNLNARAGSEITLLGAGFDGSVAASVLTVAGVFKSGVADLDRGVLMIPLGTFSEVFSMGDRAHSVVVSPRSLGEVAALRGEIQGMLGPRCGLVALDWRDLISGLEQLIEADWTNGWFIFTVLVLVVTLSILNTFLMSVLERTREFGVLLALGLSPWRIGALVLAEAFLLVLLGVAAGLSAGFAASYYFHVQGFSFPGMKELYAQYGLPGAVHNKLALPAFVLGPSVVLAFTLAAALVPALRVRRLRAVEAMKEAA